MKTLFSLLTALLLSSSAMAVETGTMAPDFEAKDHTGTSHKLSDFKGKHVVLEWYNDECPYVEKHYDAGNMQKLQKEFTAKGVVWLSVNSSAKGKQGNLSEESAKKLIEKRKSAQTAILFDHDGNIGKAYEAKTTPHMYIINPEGKLVYQGAIDDQASANPKTLENAKPLFANALNASIAGKPIENATNKPYGCSVKY